MRNLVKEIYIESLQHCLLGKSCYMTDKNISLHTFGAQNLLSIY